MKDVGNDGDDDGVDDDATKAVSLQVCFAIAFSTLFGSRFFFLTFSYLAKVHLRRGLYDVCVCIYSFF